LFVVVVYPVVVVVPDWRLLFVVVCSRCLRFHGYFVVVCSVVVIVLVFVDALIPVVHRFLVVSPLRSFVVCRLLFTLFDYVTVVTLITLFVVVGRYVTLFRCYVRLLLVSRLRLVFTLVCCCYVVHVVVRCCCCSFVTLLLFLRLIHCTLLLFVLLLTVVVDLFTFRFAFCCCCVVRCCVVVVDSLLPSLLFPVTLRLVVDCCSLFPVDYVTFVALFTLLIYRLLPVTLRCRSGLFTFGCLLIVHVLFRCLDCYVPRCWTLRLFYTLFRFPFIVRTFRCWLLFCCYVDSPLVVLRLLRFVVRSLFVVVRCWFCCCNIVRYCWFVVYVVPLRFTFISLLILLVLLFSSRCCVPVVTFALFVCCVCCVCCWCSFGALLNVYCLCCCCLRLLSFPFVTLFVCSFVCLRLYVVTFDLLLLLFGLLSRCCSRCCCCYVVPPFRLLRLVVPFVFG
jgi:hypothetical protein